MKIKYFVFLVIIGLLSATCTDDFDEYNTDKKNPENLEGEFLFSNGQKELVDYLSNTNQNINVFKLFAQYWTETTYTDEARYDIVNRNIPGEAFETYYRDVLKPLDEAKTLIEADPLEPLETEAQKTNKIQIIRMIEVYTYHNLVNIFGDVPYTEALNIDNISPAYDDAETIYTDLLSILNDALDNLDVTAASFGSADLYYGGTAANWAKFGNSLKLKIAMCLADYAPGTAQTHAEAAVTAGVFTSAADNATMAYQGAVPNTNPLHEDLVLSGRKDYVPANTVINHMHNLQDPRMFTYFTNPVGWPYYTDDDDNPLDTTVTTGSGKYLVYTNQAGEDSVVYKTTPFDLNPTTSTPDANVRVYLGGPYGYSCSYAGHSHIHPDIQTADFPGILMTYSEIEFYIAEAAARGWSVGQTAEAAYNAGVEASFAFWGNTSSEASAYLAQDTIAYDADQWQNRIGTQSYLAFYTRGLVAWDQYRRFDLPDMNIGEDPLTGGPVPRRFTYPVVEQTLNKANYEDAAAAIGGDDMLTQLFWDLNIPE